MGMVSLQEDIQERMDDANHEQSTRSRYRSAKEGREVMICQECHRQVYADMLDQHKPLCPKSPEQPISSMSYSYAITSLTSLKRKKVKKPKAIKKAGKILVKEAFPPSRTKRKLILRISAAINTCKREEGWAKIADFEAIIKSQNKGFNPGSYGFKNYKEMILALHQFFELSDALEVRQKESITGEEVSRKKIGQSTRKETTSQGRESETLSRKVLALIDRAFAITPLTAGGVKLGDLYECLNKLDPNFHIQSFGYSSLSGFFLAHNEIYRVDHLEIKPRILTAIVTRINKSK